MSDPCCARSVRFVARSTSSSQSPVRTYGVHNCRMDCEYILCLVNERPQRDRRLRSDRLRFRRRYSLQFLMVVRGVSSASLRPSRSSDNRTRTLLSDLRCLRVHSVDRRRSSAGSHSPQLHIRASTSTLWILFSLLLDVCAGQLGSTAAPCVGNSETPIAIPAPWDSTRRNRPNHY